MQAKRVIPIVIFALSAVLVVVGIIQVVLFMSPQLEAIESARQQGAAEEMISAFFWQQLIPQILVIAVTSFGIALVLAACGLISLQLNNMLAPEKEGARLSKKNEALEEQAKDAMDKDDFFEGFEALVEDD